MIVPMKKVVIFTIAEEKDPALEALRDLGVIQITPAPVSDDTRQLFDARERELHLASELKRLWRKNDSGEAAVPPALPPGTDGAAIISGADALFDRRNAAASALDALKQRLKNLEPWGDFDRQLFDAVNAAGVRVMLCSGSAKEYERAKAAAGLTVILLANEGAGRRFAVLLREGDETDFDLNDLPSLTLTEEDDPAELRKRIAALEADIADADAGIAALAGGENIVDSYLEEREEALEYSMAGDAVNGHGEVASLAGFVPEPELDKLRAAASEKGWGLYITDPDEEEFVPTLVDRGNIFTRTIGPLFDFLGIVPGYRELDVSGGVMFFFTVFYAMIIGDAGYGLLFLAGALLLAWKFRRDKTKAALVRLALILSGATVLWGALSGTWFGCSFGGLKILTDPEVKNASVQVFCFALALAQLALGHVWKAWRGNWRERLANLGWILILSGNFMTAVKMIARPDWFPNEVLFSFYAPGLLLVILFAVNWKNIANVFQFPFDIINSFTDVLSYIRLFAVGLSGAYIAGTFNGMAMDVAKASPWLIIVAVICIVAGHGLNLALGMMSVLVHAVRLNTLEFSNHTGLTWSGSAFKPFKHKNKE